MFIQIDTSNDIDMHCSCFKAMFEPQKDPKLYSPVPFKQIQRCVVWLHHRVRHLWRRNHGECFHDTIWVLFSHLRDQQGSHACTSASTKGMAKLKSLKAITTFSLLSNHIQNWVNQLSPLSVVSLCPVVSCSGLTEDEVVWTEELAERSSTNTVHGACNQALLRSAEQARTYDSRCMQVASQYVFFRGLLWHLVKTRLYIIHLLQ